MNENSATTSTLGDYREPAVVCRERGWDIGTYLIGDEGYGPAILRITAVGEASILARCLFHAGHPCDSTREGTWVLSYRDWQECDVEPALAAASGVGQK